MEDLQSDFQWAEDYDVDEEDDIIESLEGLSWEEIVEATDREAERYKQVA